MDLLCEKLQTTELSLNILQCNISCFFLLITLIYFQGSDAIQCILLDTSKIKKVKVHARTFEKMENLRMLMLYYSYPINESKVSLESPLVDLPDTLKILYWNDFPQRFWPPNFCPQNLVILEMPGCHLRQLWEGDQVFQVIYVSLCSKLSKTKISYTSMFSVLYIYWFSFAIPLCLLHII